MFHLSHGCRCCFSSPVRNWKKFGREGLTLPQVSASWNCASLCPSLSPRAVPVPELEGWSPFFGTWMLAVEGDFRMTSTHNIPFLGNWKSRIPSSSNNSQHAHYTLRAQERVCKPVYLGSHMNWWHFVMLDVSVEETFSSSWHYPEVFGTPQPIPSQAPP